MAVRRSAGPHRRAVTRMLRATGLAQMPDEAPLVELVKDLARELDEGGGARTRAAYLSALKDVRRVLDAAAVPRGTSKGTSPDPAPSVPEVPEPTSLAKFKAARGIK